MKQLIGYYLGVLLFLTSFLIHAQSARADRLSYSNVWYQSEAESGKLTGSTSEVSYGCENASGSGFVKLGSEGVNILEFNDVDVDKSGIFELRLDYFNHSTNSLKVSVNDSSFTLDFPSANWCYQGSAHEISIQIPLNAGFNILQFSPIEGINSPFLDKLSIVEAELPSIEIFPRLIRLNPGESQVLTFRATAIVSDELSFELEVSGLDKNSFELLPNTIRIPAGKQEATTTFVSTGSGSAEGVMRLTNLSEGLSQTVPKSVPIYVVSGPSTFYVSQSGNDTLNGLSPDAPLRSLDMVSALRFLPGDSILFKGGDTFIGQLRVNSSGTAEMPIIYSRYGSGPKPIIDGARAEGGAYGSAVLIRNQEGIVMEQLSITNDRRFTRQGENDQEGYGIFVHNDGDEIMRYFRFRDLTIKEIFAINTDGLDFDALTVAGIYLRSEKNTTRGKEKHIRDVIVSDCYITHTGKFGIWSQHAGGDSGIGNDSLNRNMDFIFSNNHTFETGGAGITPGRTYNCLVEGNTFEYPGSNVDPRMAARGSGAWFFGCRNVIAQFNKSLHIRGPKDSYGMHIDYGNKYVILQYNYSENSEGGFVEILGNNTYATYRYNVSVNDGLRQDARTFWISSFAGQNRIASDSNYIYNNSIYLGDNLDTDIYLEGANTFIFNNLLMASNKTKIGEETIIKQMAGQMYVNTNLYNGDISDRFTRLDVLPIFDNPRYVNPGANDANGYQLLAGSPAEEKAVNVFGEPLFPMAGRGIFQNITEKVSSDYFGNPVNLSEPTSLGAFNGEGSTYIMNLSSKEQGLGLYPNPVTVQCHVDHADLPLLDLEVYNVSGKLVKANYNSQTSMLDCSGMKPGHYIVRAITTSGQVYNQRLIKIGTAGSEY